MTVAAADTGTVFVTSKTYTGDMGGLSGADKECQSLATSANLPGTYLAWLSDGDGNSPSTRFKGYTTPYYLTDGVTRIADSWLGLTSQQLQKAINMDENGRVLDLTDENELIWSNTDASGQMVTTDWSSGRDVDDHCNNWSSASSNVYGRVGRLVLIMEPEFPQLWTDISTSVCSTLHRLVCVRQAEPTPEPRWLSYYKRQEDTVLIKSNNDWTTWYQNIANDKDEPSWLDWYTSIRDDEGFV